MKAPRSQNIGNAERLGRVIVGTGLMLLGIVVFAGSPAFWGFVGAVLAVAIGLDLAITGARGYCPLYARLGHVPRSLTGVAR